MIYSFRFFGVSPTNTGGSLRPTGWGKSIMYQLPGLITNTITLVITPLISLMVDQVQAITEKLGQFGACYLSPSVRNYKKV